MAEGDTGVRTNWAGNYTFMAPDLRVAGSVAEAQDIVAAARKVRVLGSGHSFNDIADCAAVQLSLAGLERVVRIDAARRQVTVDGGIRYGDLAPVLQAGGWALANLASLPHISVVGAVMTGTHGSGSRTGNLATQVAAIDLLTASGDIVTLSRESDGDVFAGAVISLGALGAVVGLTLDVVPDYQVRQDVFTGLRFDVIEAEFDAVFDAATSVSVFTDWCGEAAGAVWVKDRVADGQAVAVGRSAFLGAVPAREKMHPLPGSPAADCTDQLGVPGPWHERLPHFRMGFAPSHGAEIQAEFFVPREEAARAVAVMRRHGERLADVLMISEIRTVAADDLWLSPGIRGPYVGFHFTFRRDAEGVRAVLPAIEADLGELGAVPHWGKVTTMDPATIRSRTPRLAAFRELVQSFDPEGKFRNAYVERHLFEAT
jgi:xylitol oxidase